ncbi:MAG: substrate-binding domain-containing protein [Verrucomicrobiota bacterium]
MRLRIAIVISDIFLRRLTPALFPFVRNQQDYWIIDIHRPINELASLLRELQPVGILTEWLPEKTEAILELGLPTVIADTDEAFPYAISLDVDDWKVGARAATFFIHSGFQSFAFLGNRNPYSLQRLEGYQAELQKNGHSCQVHEDRETKRKTYMEHFRGQSPKLERWLKSLPKPTALFAAHDPLGRLACEVCHECQIAVPEELAVVGANNDELLCNLSYPPLSSVMIPWLKIGQQAGELLEGLIKRGEKAGQVIAIEPGQVVPRKSSDFTAVENNELRRALEYMRLHFHEGSSIQSICQALKINRRSLEIKCKSSLGRSPRHELVRMRLEKAKELLVQTDHKMDWIALQSGFSDAERLSVVFKKITGQTPSSFRSQFR